MYILITNTQKKSGGTAQESSRNTNCSRKIPRLGPLFLFKQLLNLQTNSPINLAVPEVPGHVAHIYARNRASDPVPDLPATGKQHSSTHPQCRCFTSPNGLISECVGLTSLLRPGSFGALSSLNLHRDFQPTLRGRDFPRIPNRSAQLSQCTILNPSPTSEAPGDTSGGRNITRANIRIAAHVLDSIS